MRTGPSGRYYRSLKVVSVDLDSGQVLPHLQSTPYLSPPEGVHALVWSGGLPVAELTVPGDPEAVLARLPELAALEGSRLQTTSAVDRSTAVFDGPDVTVAVCTRDRPEDLRRCLTAIAALITPVAEVLVVDNASRGQATRQVAEEFPFVRYVREPRAGLDWARNRALLEARTTIVAFTDDDAVVHPRWVEGLLRAFAKVPDAVVVTGLVFPLELATPAQVLFEARGFGRGYRRRVFRAIPGEPPGRQARLLGDAGTGADMAVLRDPVLALGGFDPALGVGTPTAGGDDMEMFFRVVATGHGLVYEPSAVVLHRHRTTMEGLARQRAGDGAGIYSFWLGAGRRYGRRHRIALQRQALRWGLEHHGRNLVRSYLYPDLWPPALSRAEARGAGRAVTGGLYRRARAQSEKQAVAHPEAPTTPPIVYPHR
ncbi:glycosyltransferase family 2 protein [Geodermatophilus sp. SYSU D00867]